MKKTENVNLLILGSRTDPGFITMLNKMLWSATGASKPMDQKSWVYFHSKITKLFVTLKITK
jgi:hypothetical protein